MSEGSIYKDIARRTGGDIYIGVVGPVRTGKSTFIRRFIDCVVLPNINDEYDRERANDQIPQSASGKTVMTTEPKFVPDAAVKITLGETELNVKLIDCVGYMVDGALGESEEGEPRMISTPWSEEPMSFSAAAELGTGKVIGEHSTIGILVTTDGTIGEIPRDNYIEAEERVVNELKELGKPFAILLNSASPNSESAHTLARQLEEKYGAPVALVSCPMLEEEDFKEILSLVLKEFPLRELKFRLPTWTEALPEGHSILNEAIERISVFSERVSKLGDVSREAATECGLVVSKLDAGDGSGELAMPFDEELYYSTLSELTGLEVEDEVSTFRTVLELSEVKKRYDKIKKALEEVEEKGYGVVMPSAEEMTLDEPRIVKQAGGYGVKLTANANSIHMIKTGIKAELCPVVGTEEQSEEVVKYLNGELEDNPEGIWECNMFGRSLYDLVNDGMNAKLSHMPDESREKMGETLERIVNEGAGGLICILL